MERYPMNKLKTYALMLVLASGSALAAERGRTPLSRSPLVVGAVSHLLLPTSASTPGKFGAFFKTKVSIFNATTYSYTIRAGLSQSGGEVATADIRMAAGQTRTYEDFLFDVFGASGAGAVDLDSQDSRFLFIVNAAVYTDSSNGRYTTSVQFGDEAANIIPSRPGFVVGVSVDEFSRLNVGCASNTSATQTITVQAFDANYVAVGQPFSFQMAPFGWNQYAVNVSLFNGGVRIDTTGNAVCFGVEVDNVSNDGTYQLAVPF